MAGETRDAGLGCEDELEVATESEADSDTEQAMAAGAISFDEECMLLSANDVMHEGLDYDDADTKSAMQDANEAIEQTERMVRTFWSAGQLS